MLTRLMIVLALPAFLGACASLEFKSSMNFNEMRPEQKTVFYHENLVQKVPGDTTHYLLGEKKVTASEVQKHMQAIAGAPSAFTFRTSDSSKIWYGSLTGAMILTTVMYTSNYFNSNESVRDGYRTTAIICGAFSILGIYDWLTINSNRAKQIDSFNRWLGSELSIINPN